MITEKVTILYGSETGTAEDVAERVAREAKEYGLRPKVSSMNEFGVEALGEEGAVIVFIAATTGQGDPPLNMQDFWKNLCRSCWKRGEFLKGLRFGVVGLGDSSYERYNFVGKKLFKRLEQLGGVPVQEVCLGDDQHDLGYHAALGPWLEKLWFAILGAGREKVALGPVAKFRFGSTKGMQALGRRERVRHCRVLGNVRVTAESHWQDTRLITLGIDDDMEYKAGDVLAVQPSNLPDNVDWFFEIFPNLKELEPVYLESNPETPWSKLSPELLTVLGPAPWEWRKLVTSVLDIQSVPRLYFFELMSKFADNELEKEKLLEFCSPQGQEDLFSYCNRPKRNILEVFGDFPHTTKNIPPIFLFDLIPAIKPRSFSIASSKERNPNEVQILVAVVEYQTKIKAKRRGLCSNWLAHHCPIGSSIPAWTDRGSFTFPRPDEDTSVILIGPGTGVAPFRSVIQENLTSWKKWLFFGCRNEQSDFYFKDEWEALQEEGRLKFTPAFSRDSEGRKRHYVQDKMLEEADSLKAILRSQNFYIYVAGSSKQMPKDVQSTLLQLIEDAGINDAEAFLQLCSKRLGRYQTETWS